MHRLAPQVDEAVFQADILGIILLARHRQRQFLRLALHVHLAREHLDLAGRQVRVHRFRVARLHLAIDGDDAFQLQGIEQAQRRAVLVRHHLGDAVMVAQVHEQDAAMVALAVDPARQANGVADVILGKLCASVGTVGVHGDSFHLAGYGAKGAHTMRGETPVLVRALTGEARPFVKVT